jgi:hypothetical protein
MDEWTCPMSIESRLAWAEEVESLGLNDEGHGLIVTLDIGERRWIEGDWVRDDLAVRHDQWPPLGTRLDAVVLGVPEDGEVRLCCVPSYVELIRSCPDLDAGARA